MTAINTSSIPSYQLSAGPDGVRVIAFLGDWSSNTPKPATNDLLAKCFPPTEKVQTVALNGSGLTDWDGTFFSVLYAIARRAMLNHVAINSDLLPEGAQSLLRLACAVPPKGARAQDPKLPFLARLGNSAERVWGDGTSVLSFVGELVLSLGRLLRGQAQFRRSDLVEIIQEAGPAGLPIVTLISVLIGLILAFIGALQLKQFGAQIFVANLVGIAMAREMGAVMVGVIIAGRTGAAYAAQLGTSEVNEEIDALKTFGISPIDFLVLPRIIALVLMTPVLCCYADIAGIFGGAVVGVGALDISLVQYLQQTAGAVRATDIWVGVIKSGFFGLLVAICGCYQGIRCGRNAAAVGLATTSAVVTSIVCLVVADATFTVIFNVLGV